MKKLTLSSLFSSFMTLRSSYDVMLMVVVWSCGTRLLRVLVCYYGIVPVIPNPPEKKKGRNEIPNVLGPVVLASSWKLKQSHLLKTCVLTNQNRELITTSCLIRCPVAEYKILLSRQEDSLWLKQFPATSLRHCNKMARSF
jgi:hypothetical protein